MRLKRRDKTLTTGGWQAYSGPGTLIYMVSDGTSLSSNVLTLYDTDFGATSGPSGVTPPTLATMNDSAMDSDFGTTVPAAVFKDGSVVATLATASANTHRGIPFANGLFINKTGDTTHTEALSLIIKPLIKKSVAIKAGTTPDTVKLFDGVGIIHGIRIFSPQAVATLDLLFKDGKVSSSLRTIITATDYTNAGQNIWSPVTTTGVDDAGAAVTTAATGAYVNEGVCFIDGLWIVPAQGSAATQNAQIDVLIEAL